MIITTIDEVSVEIPEPCIEKIPMLRDIRSDLNEGNMKVDVTSKSLNKLIEYIQKSPMDYNKKLSYCKENIFNEDIQDNLMFIRDIDFLRYNLDEFRYIPNSDLLVQIFINYPDIFEKISIDMHYWRIDDFFKKLREVGYNLQEFDLIFKLINIWTPSLQREVNKLISEMFNYPLKLLIKLFCSKLDAKNDARNRLASFHFLEIIHYDEIKINNDTPPSVHTLSNIQIMGTSGLRDYVTQSKIEKKEILDNSVNIKLKFISATPIFPNLHMYGYGLVDLISLDLSDNNMTILSDQICRLTKLQTLNLSKNKLTKLPDEMVNLVNLKEIDLSDNSELVIPDFLEGIVKN